jgi:hypothetical protein
MPKRRPLTPERVAIVRNSPACSIFDAGQIYFPRTQLYALMKAGKIRFKKIGSSTKLSVPDLEALTAMEPSSR